MSEESNEPERDELREQLGEMIYRESLRMVEHQEARVDSIRTRSSAILPLSAATVTLAASFGHSDLNSTPVWLALIALAAAAIAALRLQSAFKGYIAGPMISELCDQQYQSGATVAQVWRDLAIYHAENFDKNENGPIKKMHRWFAAEVGAALLALGIILAGIAI